jgi:hypothetical protein
MITALARFSPRAIPVPEGAKLAGKIVLGGGDAVRADVNVLTNAARTSLAVSFVLGHDRKIEGTTVRGHFDLGDVPADIAAIAAEGTLEIDAAASGTVDAPVAAGTLAADRIVVRGAAITNVSTLFRVDREKAIWHRLEATAYGGALGAAGVFRRAGRTVLTKIGAREIAIENVPLGTDAPVVMGRLSATLRLEGPIKTPVGGGRAVLEDAFYPVLVKTREALGKYGLEPPHPRADGPATADLVVDAGGIALKTLRASVPGCVATGDVRVARDGRLDGSISVVVDEEYLGSSAVLVIPAVLTERLTIPVRIVGTVREPKIDADLAACFGSFMTENRVSAFVSDAVEEVSSLFGGARPARSQPPAPPDPVDRGEQRDEDLIAVLDAARADWQPFEERLDERRRAVRRVRIAEDPG